MPGKFADMTRKRNTIVVDDVIFISTFISLIFFTFRLILSKSINFKIRTYMGLRTWTTTTGVDWIEFIAVLNKDYHILFIIVLTTARLLLIFTTKDIVSHLY